MPSSGADPRGSGPPGQRRLTTGDAPGLSARRRMVAPMVFGDSVLRSVEAAARDARAAVVEFDGARRWLATAMAGMGSLEPLAAEVWVFDPHLARVLLV